MDVHLFKAVRLKEVVEHADDGVRPLPDIHRLVNEVVNLPWDGLTTHPKESTLSGREEIDWPGLEEGQMDSAPVVGPYQNCRAWLSGLNMAADWRKAVEGRTRR